MSIWVAKDKNSGPTRRSKLKMCLLHDFGFEMRLRAHDAYAPRSRSMSSAAPHVGQPTTRHGHIQRGHLPWARASVTVSYRARSFLIHACTHLPQRAYPRQQPGNPSHGFLQRLRQEPGVFIPGTSSACFLLCLHRRLPAPRGKTCTFRYTRHSGTVCTGSPCRPLMSRCRTTGIWIRN